MKKRKRWVISNDESIKDDSNDIDLNESKNNNAPPKKMRQVKKDDIDDGTIDRT